jgi:hypothetical protein
MCQTIPASHIAILEASKIRPIPISPFGFRHFLSSQQPLYSKVFKLFLSPDRKHSIRQQA